MYQVSNHKQTTLPLALIDRGANRGVAGSDTWLIHKSLWSVHIQGIDDHMIMDVPIGTVGAVAKTQRGEVIAIMHQYAYTGKGSTIHSSGQLEWCGNEINDHSIKIDGGRQQLTTPDGYIIPIDVTRGLPYITMSPFTDEEFEELPHVIWTSEDDWDPTSLDSVIFDDPNWYKAEPSPPLPNPIYDEYGEFRGHVLINQHEWQVHYFDALDMKPGPDDDEFHDTQEQFADNPDSIIDLVVYCANRACYICDQETVEATPKFVTVGAVVNTQHGEVIAIMHQYAYTGKGSTIHSSGQLEWCGNDINNCSIKIDSGRQQLTTPDGYVIPIDFRRGLPYITMRPFTDEEFEELPHVIG
jgi:hypothetical protein